MINKLMFIQEKDLLEKNLLEKNFFIRSNF
jgi:hypothetical protein